MIAIVGLSLSVNSHRCRCFCWHRQISGLYGLFDFVGVDVGVIVCRYYAIKSGGIMRRNRTVICVSMASAQMTQNYNKSHSFTLKTTSKMTQKYNRCYTLPLHIYTKVLSQIGLLVTVNTIVNER